LLATTRLHDIPAGRFREPRFRGSEDSGDLVGSGVLKVLGVLRVLGVLGVLKVLGVLRVLKVRSSMFWVLLLDEFAVQVVVTVRLVLTLPNQE